MLSTNKTKLVRVAVALALLGTISFGAMAEWTEVDQNLDFTAYADLSTIRRSGHMVKMWKLDDENFPRATPDGTGTYSSTRSRNEYDCRDERRRQLDLSVHTGKMGRGSVVHTNNTVGQWSSVAPGSVGETFFKTACGIK